MTASFASSPAPRRQARRRRPAAPARALHPDLKIELLVRGSLCALVLLASCWSAFSLLGTLRQRHERLAELQAELTLTRNRVSHLRKDFTRVFSPTQSGEIVLEQSHWVEPQQRRVVWEGTAVNATARPGTPQ